MKKILLIFIFFFACIISIQAQTLYGLTPVGGNDGAGALIKFTPATNNLTVAKSFELYAASPYFANLIQASDGKLYGMTSGGGNGLYDGSQSGGYGVIFSYDPSTSTYQMLYAFDGINGRNPYGSLVQASDGKLYGMTRGGGSGDANNYSGYGVIFSFDPSTSIYTKLKDFGGDNGIGPNGSLLQANDGKLYGMTTYGGSNGYGVIFSFDPSSSTYTKLKDLDGANGSTPYGSLMQAGDGKFYGMTSAGGSNSAGVIFSFDPAFFTYTKLKDFDNTSGGAPYGSLVQASDGKLYGMTSSGGSGGYGVIFSFYPSTSTYTNLKDFDYTNGYNPSGNLMQASNGKLFGMTRGGGSSGVEGGVIFSFDPSTSAYTKLVDLDRNKGSQPYSSLMQANNGKIYGMTNKGGSPNYATSGSYDEGRGVIFSFDPSTYIYTKLMNLDANNGGRPSGDLLKASNGKLYGMTHDGGSNAGGVIFSFDPSTSTYTKFIDFDGANGALPFGSLIQASDGKLYGMTGQGGIENWGVIFSFDPSTSTFTKLKDIYGSGANIVNPYGSLVQASDGKLYGMGKDGYGGGGGNTIFSFDPSSATLTNLTGNYYEINGDHPCDKLIQASNRKLYGMMSGGGSSGGGVIFSFDLSTSTYTKLKDFVYQDFDGFGPEGNLIQASDGKLYGMTSGGGSIGSPYGYGVIFSFDPSTSTYTKLKDFDGANGANPIGSLVQPSDGKLYGMTVNGGSSDAGVVFSYDPLSSTYTKLKDFNDNNNVGSDYYYLGAAFIEVSNITSVSIGITAGVNPACNGQSVTFTAIPTNGGSSPSYQWKVNGNNVGSNSPTYTSATLTNGQVVSCVMTSNAPNANPTTATSNLITLTVNSAITPSVTITITTGANPTCTGQSVTFTATPTNGGTSPIYQWKVNGNNIGTNSSTFTSNSLTNGQVVSCVLTSNLSCASPATVTSNLIAVTINANVTPASSIAIISGANPSCAGQSITFTATPTNGGSSPVYQWKVNGSNVGTNSPTYISTALTTGQVVSCVMTSTLACANPVTVTSNNISITISPAVVPAITISQTSCNGNTVGFTASTANGGNNPSFLWSITGTGTATNFTGSNFTLNNAANGTQVQCSMASNANCANPVQVTSNPLTVTCVASGVVTPANLNFQVYPSPANQNALITFYLGQSIKISVEVFDVLGQQTAIITDRILNNGNQTIPWNTEKMAPGVYFVRLRWVNYQIAKKLVVVH